MRRLRLLCCALFLAVPLAAQPHGTEVVLHLQVGDSVTRALADGGITQTLVYGSAGKTTQFNANATGTTLRVEGVRPGRYLIKTLFVMGGTHYLVEDGVEIDVPETAHYEATIPVDAIALGGKVTLDGAPLYGQLHFSPSEHKPGNWGFAVPLDDHGRFAFPIPKAAKWDIEIWQQHPRASLGKLPGTELGLEDANRELDIAAPQATLTRRPR